jgi:predicted TIM-barrel fold metal-dependent hydrolase
LSEKRSSSLLSREPCPHTDVWPHVHRVIDAFGPARLMWGNDHAAFERDDGEEVHLTRATDEPAQPSAERAISS